MCKHRREHARGALAHRGDLPRLHVGWLVGCCGNVSLALVGDDAQRAVVDAQSKHARHALDLNAVEDHTGHDPRTRRQRAHESDALAKQGQPHERRRAQRGHAGHNDGQQQRRAAAATSKGQLQSDKGKETGRRRQRG